MVVEGQPIAITKEALVVVEEGGEGGGVAVLGGVKEGVGVEIRLVR